MITGTVNLKFTVPVIRLDRRIDILIQDILIQSKQIGRVISAFERLLTLVVPAILGLDQLAARCLETSSSSYSGSSSYSMKKSLMFWI